jgi:TnpA family transposase
MMQVVLSIQAGTVLPSMLLQKLGVYSRQSSLYKAFSELGRVERTLFLLEYMSDATLRQQIRAETTKVESYHQFTDWIAFGGPVLRTGDPVEQEKRIKYRDLVANAIMLGFQTLAAHCLDERGRVSKRKEGFLSANNHGNVAMLFAVLLAVM